MSLLLLLKSEAGGGGPSSLNVLLVHDDPVPTANDTPIQNALTAAGHTVTLQSETLAPPTDTSTYDVVVHTESGSSTGTAITAYPTMAVPLVFLETTWNNIRMSSAAATNPTSTTQYDIVDNVHPITTGRPDPLTWRSAASGNYGVATSSLPAGVTTLATPVGNATFATLAVADTGATLTTGTAPARRVAAGIGVGSSPVSWTADGTALFVAMVEWAGGAGAGPPTTNAAVSLSSASTLTTGATVVGAGAVVGLSSTSTLTSAPTATRQVAAALTATSTLGAAPLNPLPAPIVGIEPESHSYAVPVMDSNGNLYRITESFLSDPAGFQNQPKAMKSTDGGATWVEMDSNNRPARDTGSIGDLESGWTTWSATTKVLTFTWQRSYVVWSGFRTSDHPTNPDTWISNTRENIAGVTGSPQYASHTSPSDQSYEWIFFNNGGTNPQYRSRSGPGTYGTITAVDTTGQHPATILDSANVSHILYVKSAQLHYKTLTSAGTLQGTSTRVDSAGLNTVAIPYAAPQAYITGGTTYVGALYLNGSGHLKHVLISGGTPGSEETITTSPVLVDPDITGNQGAVISLAVDTATNTLHALWSDSATGNVMKASRPHGGAWSAPSILVTLTGTDQAQWVYGKVNTRPSGARVLSYTYDVGPHADDASAIMYNEVSLGGGATNAAVALTATSTLTSAGTTPTTNYLSSGTRQTTTGGASLSTTTSVDTRSGNVIVVQVTGATNATNETPVGVTVTCAGATVTTLKAPTSDGNHWYAYYKIAGVDAGTTLQISLTASRAFQFDHHYFSGDIGTPGSFGSRGGASNQVIVAPDYTTTPGKKVFLFAAERSPSALTTIASVVNANGRTVTQDYYADNGASPNCSSYVGEFVESTTQTGTTTITYATSTATTNAHAFHVIEATAAAPAPVLTSATPGGVGTTTAKVRVDSPTATSVVVTAATDTGLTTGVVTSSSVTPDGDGLAIASLSGLTPGTNYFFGVSLNGNPISDRGNFRTAVAGAYSFSFAAASCVLTNDDPTVLDSIRTRTGAAGSTARFFAHLGDLEYRDRNSSSAALYLGDYRAVLAKTRHKNLFSAMPVEYTWSDHDLWGDNTDSTDAVPGSIDAVRSAWSRYFPTYTLPVTNTDSAPWRSWVDGRVRFLMTDGRTYSSDIAATDNSSKTKYGAAQKQWLKDEMLAAKAAGQAIVWFHEGLGWNSTSTFAGDDSWAAYTTERTELANFITSNSLSDRVVMLIGDGHAMAYDNGTNSPGGFPVICSSPMSQSFYMPTQAQWSGGKYPAANPGGTLHQYGWFDVVDTGAATLTLNWYGYSNDDTGGTAADTQRMTASIPLATGLPPAVALVSSSTLTTAAVPQRLAAAALSSSSTLTTAAVPQRLAAATLTSSSTLTAAAVPVRLAAATLTSSSTLTTAAVPERLAAATLSSTSTLTAAAVPVRLAASALVASSTLTTAAVPQRLAASALTATSILTSAAVLLQSAEVALTANSSLSTQAVVEQVAEVALVSSSTLTSDAQVSRAASAALTATSVLTTAAVRTTLPAVALTGASTLTTAAVVTRFVSASLVATSTLAAAATPARFVSASLTATSTLNSAALRTLLPAVALTSASTLTSAAVPVRLSAVALTATSSLSTVAVREVLAASDLTAESTLTTAATPVSVAAVSLTTDSSLNAEAVVVKAGTTTLSATSTLTAAALVTRVGSASLQSTSTLTTAAIRVRVAAVALTTSSTLTTAAIPVRRATVVLTAASTMEMLADSTGEKSGAADLEAASSLSVSAVTSRQAQVSLVTSSVLTTSATRVHLVAAALSASSTLASAPTGAQQATVALLSSSLLTSASAGEGAVGVLLSATATLAVLGTRTAQPTAGLTMASDLVAAALVVRAASATLTTLSVLNQVAQHERTGAVSLASLASLVVYATVVGPGDISNLVRAFMRPNTSRAKIRENGEAAVRYNPTRARIRETT